MKFICNNDSHVVVKELLELLVDKVDGDLLEAVVLEDLESSNIKHSAEVGLLHGGVDEGVVTLDDQPLEHAVEDGPGNTSGGTNGLKKQFCLFCAFRLLRRLTWSHV